MVVVYNNALTLGPGSARTQGCPGKAALGSLCLRHLHTRPAFSRRYIDTSVAHFSAIERQEHAQDPSLVNVELVRWLINPERLLVLASVPPSSSYGANMGKSRGYIIDPWSGRILRRYTERQFRRTWRVGK